METIYQNKILYPDLIWERPVNYYKHEAGKILIVGGSESGSNKPILVAEATFRSGTGILTLAFPETLNNIYAEFLSDSMLMPLPATPANSLSHKSLSQVMEQVNVSDSVLIGPGISENAETTRLVWEIITEAKKPTLITDEALYAFEMGLKVIIEKEGTSYLENYAKEKFEQKIIFTKNSDLLKISKTIFTKDKVAGKKVSIKALGSGISSALGIIIVHWNENGLDLYLKDRLIKTPLVAEPNTNQLNILAALAASFIAQNPKKTEASLAVACYIFKKSVEIARLEITDRSIVSADIIKQIKPVFTELEASH